MSTVANILAGARAYIATLPTSRDVTQRFLEHVSNEPFDKSPIAGADGFEVVAQIPTLTRGFGLENVKEGQFTMVVRLGHSEGDIEKNRESLVQRDIARLADLLELYAFPALVAPDNIRSVFFESAVTNKGDVNWWMSELRFVVMYIGAIETS